MRVQTKGEVQPSSRGERAARQILQVLAVYGTLLAAVIGILNIGNPDPNERAVIFMGLSLIAIWCLAGGILMYSLRHQFVHWTRAIELDWRVRFVVLSTGMALIEEAVTTTLTNLAPYFGATSEAARITVSTNYFKVISTSVLAFIPWFICWAWLLGRYDFKPLMVMLLFGLTGLIAESTLDSVVNLDDLAGIGMWVYVYGLMVYLPGSGVPVDRRASPVRWYHLPIAILLPLAFVVPLTLWLVYQACLLLLRGGRSLLKRTSG